MKMYFIGFIILAMLAACSREPANTDAQNGAGEKGDLSGPYPKMIHGTIGYSYPLEDGSGKIKIGLLEFDNAAVIISGETYDDKGMEQDDAEVTLTIEPLSSDQCSKDELCFKGY